MDIKTINDLGKENLIKTGECRPTIIIKIPNSKKIDIYSLSFENDKEKEVILNKFRNKISEEKINTYTICMEAWTGKNSFIRPSEDENRKEVLLTIEYNRDNPNKSKTLATFFSRDKNNKIIFEEPKLTFNNDKSRFNFFMEDVMDEEVGNVRLKQFYSKISKEKVESLIDDFFKEHDELDVPKDKRLKMFEEFIKDGMRI